MSYENQGSPEGQDFQPSGNRPAQNARQATPGSALSQNNFPGGGEDFLGLGDEVAPVGEHLLQSQEVTPVPQPLPPRAEVSDDPPEEGFEDELEPGYDGDFDDDDVHSSWVDDTPPSKKSALPKVAAAVVLGMAATAGFMAMQRSDGGGQEGAAPLGPELNNTPAYRDNVFDHTASSEADVATTEPATGSADAVAEALDFGAAAALSGESAAEYEAAIEDAVEVVEAELAGLGDTLSEPGAAGDGELPLADGEPGVEGLVETARTELDGSSGSEGEPVVAETGVESGELTASLVPAWQAVGETLPPGAGGQVQPEDGDKTGSAGGALVVLGDDTGEPSLESSPYWDELEPGAASETESDEGVSDVVETLAAWDDAESSEQSGEDGALTEGDATLAGTAQDEVLEGAEALAQGEVPGTDAALDSEEVSGTDEGPAAGDGLAAAVVDPPVETERPVLVVDPHPEDPPPAVSNGTEVAVPAQGGSEAGPESGDPGSFGPALPEGTTAPEVATTTGEGDLGTSTRRVRRIDVQQVVDPDQRGPRRVTEAELKGVWLEEEVPPLRAIQGNRKVLTPQVGQVRVVLRAGELFTGRLYAMGEGRVWINNDDFGQMGLDGSKVVKILRLVSDGGDPGDTGVEDLAGLESIRVKTPGGILVGKVITRNEQQTTIVTDDGARVTLSSSDVVFLDEAPGVTLKRAGSGTTETKEGEAAPAKP